MMKLDISKAFDSIQWPLMIEILKILGFGQRWINWIAGLLSTSSTQILVNGIPGAPLRNHRGLRQGDMLSLMLFILLFNPLQRCLLS